MSGHTPGPWAVEPSWSERCGGGVSIVNREHMGDDWDVCIVYSSEANARLIAAAPELLEALQVAFTYMDPASCPEAEDVETVRAAIAAATGENS